MREVYKKALELAFMAHKDQRRRSSDEIYFMHPLRVAAQIGLYGDKELKAAAILHDVLEDTPITENDLRAIFPKRVVDLVVLLTHKKDEPYEAYIRRVKTDQDATKIKIADIHDNLNSNPTEKQLKKYAVALGILEAE